MGSRHRSRDYGRGGQRGEGRDEYRASFERGGFRDTDFGDRSEYGREENYFGSGRQQYGSGYTGTGRTSRDMGDWTGDYGQSSDLGGRRSSGRERDREDRDRGYSEGRRSYGSEGQYGRGSDEDYYNGPTGGMIGGGLGGYTGGGYQGYTGEQNRGRSQGGWSGYGGGNYGRGDSSSERDYGRGSYYGRGSDYDRDRGNDDRGFFERIGDEVSSWFGGEDDRQSDRNRQSFRGRGPRNYSRSDDRIKEDINDRLTDHHYIDASDIDVEVNGGEVILTGTVDSRYAKRMAEDIAEDVSGVHNVENRIRVNKDWGNSPNYSETTTSSTGTAGSTTGATNTGNAGLAAGSGTSGRTGTSGAVTNTESTSGTTGTGGTSNRGKGRSAGA
jgi:osmotically-inducible protein OsmY